MDRLEDISRRRDAAHRRWLSLGFRVYGSFLDMERAAYADGSLSRKEKELIAVGISVVTDCESCMQWHIGQAARAGAAYGEVLEAVEVAIEMAGGRATVSARFAFEVMDAAFGRAAT
jgi:AhpD family alkylhydroperoxidase